ncbi:hypothetical protein NYG88_08490 [Campylobacter felis]|nr:hypothetical protein [Campylobacter felis]
MQQFQPNSHTGGGGGEKTKFNSQHQAPTVNPLCHLAFIYRIASTNSYAT